jgi:superfamily II DNA helicase RecQ
LPGTRSQSLPFSDVQHCDSSSNSQVTLSQQETQRHRINGYPADSLEEQQLNSKRPCIEQVQQDDSSAPTSTVLLTLPVIQSNEKTSVSPHEISLPLIEIPLPAFPSSLTSVGIARMRALGVTTLRQGQEMMMNILQQNANQHSLIVLPTGSGKTKLVLLDAMLRNVCNIVFVPFTQIAKDLLKFNICEDGARLNVESWASIRHDFSLSVLNANVVVASFEHACQDMIPFLQCLQERGRLGFCFVDEVDVVLHAYRCFSQFWSLAAACPLVKIKAMTATLRPRDKVSVEAMLGIRFDSEIRQTCRRDDISLSSRFYPNQVAVMRGLVGFIASLSTVSKVLIFCMTIKEAEYIGETLLKMFSQQVSISHSRRRDPLERIAVVTSCFGHGVNVLGLSHVVVVRSAWSIEGFVQASSPYIFSIASSFLE